MSFGPYTIDPKAGELRRDGVSVPLQDLPFRLLAALVERPGELVTRAELTARLWGSDTFVDSTAGLNTAVAKLRDALGDNADQPLYIETVPKRGYRFVGSIAVGIDATNVARPFQSCRAAPREPSQARATTDFRSDRWSGSLRRASWSRWFRSRPTSCARAGRRRAWR